MVDPLIRECSHYVVISPIEQEEILTEEQTIAWLIDWLKQIEELPMDLKGQKSLTDAAIYLLDTACELQIKPGFNLQWFAVRLNPPDSEVPRV